MSGLEEGRTKGHRSKAAATSAPHYQDSCCNWSQFACCIHSASLLGCIHRGQKSAPARSGRRIHVKKELRQERPDWRLNEMKPSLTGPKFYRGENTSCSEPSHSSTDSMSNCLNPVVDESPDSPAATAAQTQSRDRFTLAHKHGAPEQVTKCFQSRTE